MNPSPDVFSNFGFHKAILLALEQLGYNSPTPIQQKVIPLIMDGQDLIGIAQTGTGKTAAFLLPILHKIAYNQDIIPQVLILAPTRELVIQIYQDCSALSEFIPLQCMACYGGLNIKKQIEKLQYKIDIIISTPQRLVDIYAKGGVYLRKIKTFIIDEADKMVDMGFMPQINNILEIIPNKKRQNLLFSASMPSNVIPLIDTFLINAKKVVITPQSTVAQTIETYSYDLPNRQAKVDFIVSLLNKQKNDQFVLSKVIIFTNSKRIAMWLYNFLIPLSSRKISIIHANKDQNTRLNLLNSFKADEIDVLISTDLISRGLHISDISHVINFELPYILTDYVHRVGRTGRVYKNGIAINLCNQVEKNMLKHIEKMIGNILKINPLPKNIIVQPTPFEEQQEINKALDFQRRQNDPTYKGAFHSKKKRPTKTKKTHRTQRAKKNRKKK